MVEIQIPENVAAHTGEKLMNQYYVKVNSHFIMRL